jgi:AcrR family transcriptional regulator
MRRLATELGVAPGALYYHVRNKQELLTRLAGRMLGPTPDCLTESTRRIRLTTQKVSEREVTETVVELARTAREAVLRYQDGADVIGNRPGGGPGVRLLVRGDARDLRARIDQPDPTRIGRPEPSCTRSWGSFRRSTTDSGSRRPPRRPRIREPATSRMRARASSESGPSFGVCSTRHPNSNGDGGDLALQCIARPVNLAVRSECRGRTRPGSSPNHITEKKNSGTTP